MSFRVATILTLAAALSSTAFAEDAAEEPQENPELEAEIAYVEALVQFGFPDFAGPVIEATKKKWPESEVRFFAIEVRSLLALGKFDEAEKKIAALPDRKSAKYWAARLEVAVSYFYRGQKPECMKIYDEFFALFPKPTKELRKFHMDASFAYGQLLTDDRQYEKAVARYEQLVDQLPKGGNERCNVSCELIDLYLRLANALTDVKDRAKRGDYLKKAEKVVDSLLWLNETRPLYFGRAVSMKAHIAEMRGDVARATEIIDDYRPQLQAIHAQILAADPEGRAGVLKQSPLPECLYLQAKILWDAAEAEYGKKPKRDDERVKVLLFGPKERGRRQTSKGAFAMAQGVFLNYETSAWAPAAGDLAEAIRRFTKEKYGVEVKTKVTAEQIAKVRAAQFKDANEKFLAQRYEEAIKAYDAALAKFPEYPESVRAAENVASCYIDLAFEEKNEAKKAEYRMNADAVEGYLAERFAGAKNGAVMNAGGDAVARLAAKEEQLKNRAQANWLYTELLQNYLDYGSSSSLGAAKAMEFQKAERYTDAMHYWGLVAQHYTNSTLYATSLAQLSYCAGRLGDKKAEIGYITKYLAVETVKIRRLQAQFQLAQMYQRDGLAILAAASTNDTPEGVEADERRGTAQIIRAIRNFDGFSADADAALADPSTVASDAGKFRELKEAAMFMVGECWSRMNRPEKNLKMYRERAAQSYEAYVAAYPEGQWAKVAYVKLGTIYTALGDVAKSKEALDGLSRKFPDSDEAKNAKPRLAKSLMEMGMRKEGTDIYAEMLRTDGAYTAGQYVNAGEALIGARSWDLANQAFEKAIRLAGTNQVVTAARARLGLARTSWKQGSLAEAREALDLFLSDPKMSKMAIAADANFMLVEVASDQGRTEKDATMRTKCFNAAIGALKKVRQYWRNRPQWEQDQLDLLSGDVLVDRMKAEEAMGLKEEALETCGGAASKFQTFLQAHGVNESHPFDQMEPGEVANLERAYSSLVPLLVKQGAAQADLVLKYGQQYLDLFPGGKFRTLIENSMNQARADLPSATAPAAAAAEGV